MPYIAFNHQGQLVEFYPNGNPKPVAEDVDIPLARGAVIPPQDPVTKKYIWRQPPQIVENPPNNSINNPNFIHIDWMTGRAKIERPELPGARP